MFVAFIFNQKLIPIFKIQIQNDIKIKSKEGISKQIKHPQLSRHSLGQHDLNNLIRISFSTAQSRGGATQGHAASTVRYQSERP